MKKTPSQPAKSKSLADWLPSFLFPRISGMALVAIMIAVLLTGLLIVPVLQVVYVAFLDPNSGALTLNNFRDFFGSSLFRESFCLRLCNVGDFCHDDCPAPGLYHHTI